MGISSRNPLPRYKLELSNVRSVYDNCVVVFEVPPIPCRLEVDAEGFEDIWSRFKTMLPYKIRVKILPIIRFLERPSYSQV
jgi:hypothetical protein